MQALEFGRYYHIYNRGVNSCNLFEENSNFEHFLRLYEKYILPVADTFAYCLMSNHLACPAGRFSFFGSDKGGEGNFNKPVRYSKS